MIIMNKSILLYTAYYYDIKLCASDNKKLLKEFLKERKMFTKIYEKIRIEKCVIDEKTICQNHIGDIILDNSFGTIITGLEFRIIKEDYFNYLDNMCNTKDNLKQFMILANDKNTILKTIEEIDDVLADPYEKFPEWIQSHSLINKPNIYGYIKEMNEYISVLEKCGIKL